MAEIDYFYSAHSAYAYLGAWELERIAQAHGAAVRHRPFDLGPVMAAAGGQPFGARSKAHVDYFFGRDMVRWAQIRGLPILRHRPTHHDNPLDLPNGVIIASDDPGPLSRAILQAHWRDDADIAEAATLKRLAEEVSQDGAALLEAAQQKAARDTHAANTDEAIARGFFGSPTYVVDGEMFYGQDHLMMVEMALDAPFAP